MVVRFLFKVVAGVVAMGLLLTYIMLVRPLPRDKVQRADAVVVLAGESDRLTTGFRLVAEGKADVLVISNGTAPGWKAANLLCSGTYKFKVMCPEPSSDSTRGEARTIARLSRENSWKRVVLVSSNFHLRRARTLFHRCFKGELRVYSSEPERLSFGTWAGAVMEWPKTAAAQVSRSC